MYSLRAWFTFFLFLSSAFLAVEGVFYPPEAAAQRLASIDAAGLNVEIRARASEYQVKISPKGGLSSLDRDLTANVFSVENPTRLVVDIPGFIASSPQSVQLSDRTVSGLRLGVHSDKTRLVIDIDDPRAPSYNVVSDASLGALLVKFSFGAESASFASAADANAAEPTAPTPPPSVIEPTAPDVEPAEPDNSFVMREDEIVDAPEGTLAALEKDLERNSAPREPAMPPRTNPSRTVPGIQTPRTPEPPTEPSVPVPSLNTGSSGAASVRGVYYQTTKNSKTSSLMVDVEGLNSYSLTQRAQGQYELLLRNAKLSGTHLTLPQFPPDTFKGFEVIRALEQGDDVIIKVFTESDITLSPFIAQGRLWIRVSN